MRILAIRGRNLASLYKDFELDFTSPPLFGCGLFCITGETGAGKSTILDAMCLALYGRFPRITAEGPKDKIENAQGESLQTNDPRSILRTGSSEGMAQVDLMVGDKHLRASWQVRRAYGKASGNLLDFERSLIDLSDGSVLASGKKRVDEEISKRLKLTYEQFGRTVLLAQNEFDAFLRANDGDRADLLEKITGTDLYSKISAKAYEIERQALRDLEDQQQRTGFISVLPDEQRSELCAVIKSTESSHQEQVEHSQKIRAGLEWYQRRDEAIKRVEEAKQQVLLAQKQLDDWVVQKQQLSRFKIATGLAAVVDKADQAKQILSRLEQDVKLTVDEQATGRKALAAAENRLLAANNDFMQAEKILREAAPGFEQALKLDTQINSHNERLTATQAIFEREQKSQSIDMEQMQSRRVTGEQLKKQQAVLEGSLHKNAGIEALSIRSNDLADLFQRLIKCRQTIEKNRAKKAQKQQLYMDLHKQVESHDKASSILHEQRAIVKNRRDEKAKALRHTKPDETRLKRDQQIELQNQLNSLGQHFSALVENQVSRARTTEARMKVLDANTTQRLALDGLEVSLQDLKSRASEAQDVLQRSATILSKPVLQLRAGLQEDEACPVCGSKNHPGHADRSTDELLAKMRQRSHQLATDIADIEEKRLQATLRLEQATARLENADERLESLKKTIDGLTRQNMGLYASAEQAAFPLGLKIVQHRQADQQHTVLKKLLESHERQTETTQKQLLVIHKLEGQVRSLEEKVISFEKAEIENSAQVGKLAIAEKTAFEELAQCDHQLDVLRDRQKYLLEQFETLLSDIDISHEDLQRDPNSVQQFLRSKIAHYDQQKIELIEVTKKIDELRAASLLTEQKTKQRAQRLGELDGELADLREDLTQTTKQRAKLFDGALVAGVRQVMEASLRDATKALQETRADQHKSATRLEEIDKNIVRQSSSAKRAKQAHKQAVKTLDAALKEQQISLQEVRSALDMDVDYCTQLAVQLAQRERAQTSGKALLLDGKQHLAQINKQPSADGSKGQLTDMLQEIEAEKAMLMIDLGKNKSQLELDDAALKQRAKLSGKIEKLQQTHERWAIIAGAIGSKDGAKFRRFAQGVTLDHLIGLANQQLRNINPRYKIERNLVGGLGLQVLDVEMGGEIRSVRSLSGGERFLVSLALALALSQLDGRASFVDTLMIDEGFGALDARSLDIVIEALESLQSQGRKVGVISHVEALTDRIPVQIKVEKQGNGRSRVRVFERGQAY